MDLNEEAKRATDMLKNKKIEMILRHHKNEITIQFTDGSRLFIDQTPDGLELSITGENLKD